jgi:ATP-dependent DNA ligase
MTMRFRYPDKPTEVSPDFVRGLKPQEWIAQGKYDGWRALICIDGAQSVRILSRENHPLQETKSPERRQVIERMRLEFQSLGLPPGTILDSELVGPRGKHDWAIYIFDCLAWEGTWLARTPFEQRWAKCREIGPKIEGSKRLFLAETIFGSPTMPNAFLDHFYELKSRWERDGRGLDLFEGIVLKRRTGTLLLRPNSCAKSNHMFKLKYRDIRDARF